MPIRELTRRGDNGEVYTRPDTVQRECEEVSELNWEQRINRARIPNPSDDGYLREETLVFLFREALFEQSRGGSAILDRALLEIYEVINSRLERFLKKSSYKPERSQDYEDWAARVQDVLIRKLMNKEEDLIDFAEARFFSFVSLEGQSQRRSFIREDERRGVEVELDKPNEEGHDFVLKDGALSPEEAAMLKEALWALPDKLRELVVLVHLDGWKIESGDPTEPTVSKYYGVSSRAIRNWLGEAKRILREHIGGQG